jgi:hypothetical protein
MSLDTNEDTPVYLVYDKLGRILLITVDEDYAKSYAVNTAFNSDGKVIPTTITKGG